MRKNEKILSDFSSSLLELLESDIPLKTSLEVLSSGTGTNERTRRLAGELLENYQKDIPFQRRLPLHRYMFLKRS